MKEISLEQIMIIILEHIRSTKEYKSSFIVEHNFSGLIGNGAPELLQDIRISKEIIDAVYRKILRPKANKDYRFITDIPIPTLDYNVDNTDTIRKIEGTINIKII